MPSKPAARLLIADDHKILADLCKQMLEPEFEVVDVVTDGRALLQAAAELKPDIIIVDINMPQLNGLDAGEQIKKKLPRTKLVYLTMNMSAEIAAEAFPPSGGYSSAIGIADYNPTQVTCAEGDTSPQCCVAIQ